MAPGKVTLTSQLGATGGQGAPQGAARAPAAGQRPGTAGANAAPRVRSLGEWTRDRWINAAHGYPQHPVQRQEAPPAAPGGEESPLARARRTMAIGDIAKVRDFGPASDSERLAFLRAMLDQRWVDNDEERVLVRIWTAFGERMLDVANQQPALWRRCIDRGAELHELPAVAAVQRRFRTDVRALARDILGRNEQHVRAEMQALGVTAGGDIDPAGSVIPEDEQADYLAQLQERAEDLVAARHALRALRRVPVGFRPVPAKVGMHWVRATFDPARPPPAGLDDEAVPGSLRRAAELRTWDEVKAHHDRLQVAIALLASESPALYAAASRDDDAQLADMAAAPPGEARRVMAANLRDLLANIRATLPKLGGDLDDRELTVLHEQLFRGQRGPSGIDWSQPVHQGLAREVVRDYERAQFWTSLGLGTLAAAAFVVAELATLGSATFFAAAGVGLGAGSAMAARGWESWDDLATAANASAGQDGQIVSQGQADSALTTAVVDSAFAFLDLIPAVKAARTVAATRRGTQAAAGQGADRMLARGADASGEVLTRDGASIARDGASAGGREAAGRVAREGAGEGIEETAGQGAGAAARRLRPQDAANWQELAQHYLGRKLVDAGVPPGYRMYRSGGRKFLRRIDARDDLFARLTVDAGGVIQAGRAKPLRVSNARRAAESAGRILERTGLPRRPPHHQAHHVVPNEVVRTHPLMRAAHQRGLFDPDAPDNLALLAMREVEGAEKAVPDKVPGLSVGLPRHQGAHPLYSEQVTNAANREIARLLRAHDTLDNVPDEILREASAEVRDYAWEILRTWDGPHLK